MRPGLLEFKEYKHRLSTRGALLRTGAVAGAVASLPLAARLFGVRDAAAAPSKAQDGKILQLVLQLEYTQVAFYEQALKEASLNGELRTFATTALEHERAHLAAIKSALGDRKS